MFRRSQILTIAALILSFHSVASAQTFTWDGSESSNWYNTDNWAGGVAPQPGGVVLFDAATSNQTVSLFDLSANQLDTVRFNSGSAAYLLENGTLGLQGNNLIEVTAGSASHSITMAVELTGSGTIRNDGTGTLSLANIATPNTLTVEGGGNVSVTGVISGNGALTKTGSGTLTLTNTSNTYTGATTISGGTLNIGSGSNLGNGSQLIFDGGTLGSTGTFTMSKDIVVNAGGGTVHADGSSYSISGQHSVSGGLTKSGIGTVRLIGTSTYTGVLTVSDGVIGIGASTYSIGGLAGSGDVSNTSLNGVANLSVGGGGQDTTFSGGLRDSNSSRVLALTKTGTGTLTLSGTASTYTGATTISAGTLAVNGSLAAGSAVSVNGGSLGGIGTVNGSVSVANGAAIAPGNSSGTLTVGSLNFDNGSLFNAEALGLGVIGCYVGSERYWRRN